MKVATATPQPDLGANQEGSREAEFISVRFLCGTANLINARKGLGLSGSRIRKLVRLFVRSGGSAVEFRQWFLSYADPTGEAAVRNVIRERGF